MKETDQKLLQRCLAGDALAWETFVERFTPVIYSAIFSVLSSQPGRNNEIDSRDLYHHVLVSLMENDCEKLRQYKGLNNAKLSTWLAVVTTRKAINILRRETRPIRPYNVEISGQTMGSRDDGNYQDQEERKNLWTEVRRVIREKLNAREQLFLRLFLEKELPVEEISGIMKLKINNVYVLKTRVLKKIRKNICKKNLLPVSN